MDAVYHAISHAINYAVDCTVFYAITSRTQVCHQVGAGTSSRINHLCWKLGENHRTWKDYLRTITHHNKVKPIRKNHWKNYICWRYCKNFCPWRKDLCFNQWNSEVELNYCSKKWRNSRMEEKKYGKWTSYIPTTSTNQNVGTKICRTRRMENQKRKRPESAQRSEIAVGINNKYNYLTI